MPKEDPMITLSMAAPTWWRPAAPPNWAALDRKIAEMERQVHQYPPRRKEPRMSPTRKIDGRAIYAARRAHQMILPAERSRDLCGETCFAARGGDPSMCADASCWAQAVAASARATGRPKKASSSKDAAHGMSAAAVYASRRLQLERGRTPAPRPRSLHDVIRDHYRSRA